MKAANPKVMTNAFELRGVVDDLCRKHFGAFAQRAFSELEGGQLEQAWHIRIICRLLEKVHQGDVRRALVCIPPRYLKTYLITIAYTAWMLGKNPKARIICASYGASLAEKFSADTLRLMRSAWYRRVFPNTHLDPKKQSKVEIGTTVGGYRFATSVEATLTGRGADVIIIDDPLKASEAHSPTARQNCIDWFNSTVHTRFDHPKKGRLITVAQRLHAEDLPGHLIEVGGWEELILPAINPTTQVYDIVAGGKKVRFVAGRVLQPSRHDENDLALLKKQMGEHDFEAQFNQRPVPPGGATFKEVWIKRYDGAFGWAVGLTGGTSGSAGGYRSARIGNDGIAGGLGYKAGPLRASVGVGRIWQDSKGLGIDGESTVVGADAEFGSILGFSAYAGVQFGKTDAKSSRMTSIGSINDELTASFDSKFTQVYGEVSYSLGTDLLSFGPFAGLSVIDLNFDDVEETGGPTALTVTDLDRKVTFGRIGAKAQGSVSSLVSLEASAAWRNAWGDREGTASVRFDGNSQSATISGVSMAKNALELDAHVTVGVGAAKVTLGYDGSISKAFDSHGAKIGVAVSF